ncbi:alpha-amylase family protein [Solitalea canadensis]|uniref:Glycosidase n=1 Tax=Solitalea canadensis (strain ATCC 29591 / DSM 3403 / JCM 21819 / LMG 8368 / NBRC 15130 / NCIMB 12057 / USAM 9D) TaxID=929556 RepID=H8KR93_SOLCM|nr:alpha-amylase family protein [Solitalea canadensis]AFD07360.1 glycosidase [Solitalea canadensis DSM 3403]
MYKFIIAVLITVFGSQLTNAQTMNANTSSEKITDNKLIIYQMMTRLFGNTNTTNKFYGSKDENGVGKFNDISAKALAELRKMGVSHVWYTGVIEQATMTDYSAKGIKMDDPDVVKGRAGSPYAIKDYYDVNPDLAVNTADRMKEFEALIARTHAAGMKVIIDFVPNHVARTYYSDVKPSGVIDLGEKDDKSKAFDPNNNFYYLPGQSLIVPDGYNAGGTDFKHSLKDGKFNETPAKATGNDVFSATPSINDWFETVKLNYGVDYQNNRAEHFDPVPNTWKQMKDILLYWTAKGVDGFRCDMCEMVPVQFWNYAISEVKTTKPTIKFIGEAYDPKVYRKYIEQGKFDYLYDKVGLYDTLKYVIQHKSNVEAISQARVKDINGITSYMLNFLENHDEQRIASKGFAGDAKKGIPMMTISSTISSGPVMIYFGQEVGEPGLGVEGFGGEDGRTTIFDYWGVPEHQKWVNNGKFDGGNLSPDQKKLRAFYSKLLNVSSNEKAIREGQFYELQSANDNGKSSGYNPYLNYSYLRFTDKERVMVVNSFDQSVNMNAVIKFSKDVFQLMKLDENKEYTFTDLLGSGYKVKVKGVDLISEENNKGVPVKMPFLNSMILKIEL